MEIYNIQTKEIKINGKKATQMLVGFGQPANNPEIVRFVDEHAPELNGRLLLINGRASLPVAFVLAHKYLHTFGAVGVFDPKLAAYVIVSSHTPEFEVGDII